MTPRKGISPLIATVVLIALVFALAALLSPWATNLAKDITNETAAQSFNGVRCQGAALDFDNTYETSGLLQNFTGANPVLRVKMINRGTIDLYNFSLEVQFNSSVIKYFYPQSGDQKTRIDPLRPGQSLIINATISPAFTGTLNSIRIIPQPCTSAAVQQNL